MLKSWEDGNIEKEHQTGTNRKNTLSTEGWHMDKIFPQNSEFFVLEWLFG